MTDHPIPAPWGRTPRPLVADSSDWEAEQAPRVGRLDRDDIDAALRGRLSPMACPGCNLYAKRGECDCLPPADMSMCDPDLLAVAPDRRWFDPALDFAAGCVLALAMSLMEEPKRAGRMSWKRRMVHAKAITWAVLAWGFLALVLWASKP
jgi:hypothetical protein